jgi:UDP-glucose:(heptosyl)LPS alpha-1,3-glucosyltransferase
MKRRLAIIRKRFNPFGGAERVLDRLINELRQHPFDVTLISESWPPSYEGATVIKADSKGFTRTTRMRSFEQSVQEILSTHSFDLVQSHERMTGVDICRLGDGIHQAWVNRLSRERSGAKRAWLSLDPYHGYILETERKMALDKEMLFVVNSTLVARELQDLYNVDANRIREIPNGLDIAYFSPPSLEEKLESRQALNLDQSTPILAFIGSGFRRKGLFELIRAMPLLKDAFLLIAGEDKERNTALALSGSLGLKDRVRFLGGVSDVRRALWASDLFCLPSLYDPSPNAAIEALCCGLPVVCTADVGLASLVVQWDAGSVCSREPESIAETIARKLKNAQDLTAKNNARNLGVMHDQRRVTPMWISLYQSLVKTSVAEL